MIGGIEAPQTDRENSCLHVFAESNDLIRDKRGDETCYYVNPKISEDRVMFMIDFMIREIQRLQQQNDNLNAANFELNAHLHGIE